MHFLNPQDVEKHSSSETQPVIPQPQTYRKYDDSSVESPASFKYLWLTIVTILVITGVGVGTYLIENNTAEPLIVNGLQTPTPNSLKPNEEQQIVTDPTASWSVYQNQTVGFTLKYPSSFSKPVEEDSLITFSSPAGRYELIMFPYEGTLEDLFEERSTNIVTGDSQIPVVFSDIPQAVMRSALLDTYKAFWYETVSANDETKGREIHFIGNGTGFIFKAYPEVVINEPEMEQMIMSFKTVAKQASPAANITTPSGRIR